MGGSVLVIFYGSIFFCLVATGTKLYYYARFPVHLRWEIYRASSVYEQGIWWEEKRIGTRQKLAGILRDVFSLREYYRNNKNFWLALFAFHLGVYLLILWHIWLFVYPSIFRVTPPTDYALIWGHTATGLIFLGALGILIVRTRNPTLRSSYPRLHYLKWTFILLAAGSGFFAVQYYFNGVMADVLGYVKHQLQFDMESKLNPPAMTSFHVLTVAAVLIYLPFSHALRLFFRYYHELRWNYVPSPGNKSVSRSTRTSLQYPIAWAAKHAPAGTSWKDLLEK